MFYNADRLPAKNITELLSYFNRPKGRNQSAAEADEFVKFDFSGMEQRRK